MASEGVRKKRSVKQRPVRHNPICESTIEQNKFIVNDKKIATPSNLMFGFIGLGLLGKQIVKRLLESGHKVCIWNKTSSECDIFLEMGAKVFKCPADLIINCDVTICCVLDPNASKGVIFGKNGVLHGLEKANSVGIHNKGYVEMSNIDPSTSQIISEAILRKRGYYLEAPVCGTSKGAEEGKLLIVAGGEKKLFDKCETCFCSIAENVYYVSSTPGDAFLISLIYSTFNSFACVALAESMVLTERLKLQKSYFLDFLKCKSFECRAIIDKSQKMDEQTFEKVTALKVAQKDIRLVLSVANDFSQRMHITTAVNEIFKLGRHRNYSNEDKTAVYKAIKH